MALAYSLIAPVIATAHPSFACKGKLSPAETKICADDELADLDVQLSAAFSTQMENLPPAARASLKLEQQDWIAKRDVDCGLGFRPTDFILLKPEEVPETCLKDKYEKRIDALAAWTFNDAYTTFGFTKAKSLYTPRLLESHNDVLCSKFLAAVTDDFFTTHRFDRDAPDQPLFKIPGGKFLTLPTVNTIATLEASLDGHQQKSVIVYESRSFSNGSGEHRFITLRIQTKYDPARLKEQIQENDKQFGQDKSGTLVGIPPFNYLVTAWDPYNPISLLEYGEKYYFFYDFPGRTRVINLQALHASGSTSRACQVQVRPAATFPAVPPGNAPDWRGDFLEDQNAITDKIDVPPELGRFFGVIRRIQGDEGPFPGTMHALARLQNASDELIEKTIVEPWDALAARSAFSSAPSVDKTEWAIDQWGASAISNYHLAKKYHAFKEPAYTALSNLYQTRFGLPGDTAKRYSSTLLDQIISGSFHFQFVSVERTENADLAEKLLKGAPWADIEKLVEAGSWAETLNAKTSYGEPTWFFALEHANLLERLIRQGADINATNYFGKTALMYAAQFDLLPSVTALLKNGALADTALGTQPNATPDFTLSLHANEINIRCDQRTALMYAAENASAPVIQAILSATKNPTVQDSCKRSASDYLVRNIILSSSDRAALTKRLAAP